MLTPAIKMLSILFAVIVGGGTWLNAAEPLTPTTPPLLLGVAWYPEQWLPNRYPGRWDVDLSLMEQAHIHFVRMREFAWSAMEPSEGDYNFVWLDQAIGRDPIALQRSTVMDVIYFKVATKHIYVLIDQKTPKCSGLHRSQRSGLNKIVWEEVQ